MFKDTEKELKRLEEELLAQEEEDEASRQSDEEYEDGYDQDWEEMFDEAPAENAGQEEDWQDMTRVFYGGVEGWQDETRVYNTDALQAQQQANRSCGGRIYNTDKTDEDLSDYGEQIREPAGKSLTGLMVTAALLTAGILGVVIFWLVRYGGVLG